MLIKNTSDLINILNFKFSITVTTPFIIIGCKQYLTLEDFLSKYKNDGKNNGYSERDLQFLKVTISNAVKYLKGNVK